MYQAGAVGEKGIGSNGPLDPLRPRDKPFSRGVRAMVWADIVFKPVPLQEGEEGELEVQMG